MAGRGLGFHLCVLEFGGDGNRLEPACNGFRVVGGVVSFLSLSGLAWAGSGMLCVARGGSLFHMCVRLCTWVCAM